MPAPLNLLTALSDQDMSDLHEAAAKDPTLLQAPKLSIPQELARGMNDLTRFFGLTFGDPNALKAAAQTSEEFDQSEQANLMAKLLPVLGESRARHADEQRQHQEQQTALARTAAIEHVGQNYVVDDGKGGIRPLTMDEAVQSWDALNDFGTNPQAGIDHTRLPHGIRAMTAIDKDQMLEDRQTRSIAASEDRASKARAQSEEHFNRRMEQSERRTDVAEQRLTDSEERAAKADTEKAKKEAQLKPEDVEKLLNVDLSITGDDKNKNIRQAIAKAATPEALKAIDDAIGDKVKRYGTKMSEKAADLLMELSNSVRKRQTALETAKKTAVQRPVKP